MALMEKELLTAQVTCSWKDLDKFRRCDCWIVEAAEFNTDTQVGELILRQFTLKDL